MTSSENNDELLAMIPFKKGKAIEYYDDRLAFNEHEILYEDITGYGYSLTTYSQSVNFVPTYNSKTVSLGISVGNDRKPILFTRKVDMPMGFHTEAQMDLPIIFSEIIKLTDAFLYQRVLNKLYSKVLSGESVYIGDLIIEQDSIRKKGIFKEKELYEYGRTYLRSGNVIIEDGQGRVFSSTSLGVINAPILGSLLEALFRD